MRWTLLAKIVTAAALVVPFMGLQIGPAQAVTVDQDPFSIQTDGIGLSVSFSSPHFASSTGRVKSCVHPSWLQGAASPTWNFAVIWPDHGKNVVVWQSRTYSTVTGHCSRIRREPGKAPRYFTRVTVTTAQAGSPASMTGVTDITTDF